MQSSSCHVWSIREDSKCTTAEEENGCFLLHFTQTASRNTVLFLERQKSTREEPATRVSLAQLAPYLTSRLRVDNFIHSPCLLSLNNPHLSAGVSSLVSYLGHSSVAKFKDSKVLHVTRSLFTTSTPEEERGWKVTKKKTGQSEACFETRPIGARLTSMLIGAVTNQVIFKGNVVNFTPAAHTWLLLSKHARFCLFPPLLTSQFVLKVEEFLSS